MNTTTALCGHSVIAIGAPGSAMRAALNNTLCPTCAEKRKESNPDAALILCEEILAWSETAFQQRALTY